MAIRPMATAPKGSRPMAMPPKLMGAMAIPPDANRPPTAWQLPMAIQALTGPRTTSKWSPILIWTSGSPNKLNRLRYSKAAGGNLPPYLSAKHCDIYLRRALSVAKARAKIVRK